MKKEAIIAVLVLLLFPSITASSLDDEIGRITHYAEEYETGNIDYVQFTMYLGSTRQSLNEVLGAVSMQEGGLFNQEQIESALGNPTDETKWVWVEGEEREKKLDNEMPFWEKIIFDGKKIQIRLGAHPSIFNKKPPEFYEELRSLEEQGNFEEIGELKRQYQGEDILIYRLNFQIDFKRPQEQINVENKISEIKGLAEIFNSDSSSSNAESLAKASVDAERAFENFFRQSSKECMPLMTEIFGSENLREEMQTIRYRIDFYSGDNFEAIMDLNMCDDCNWNWIDIHMWIEGRGPGFNQPKNEFNDGGFQRYKGMSKERYMSETEDLVNEIRTSLDQKNYNSAISKSNELSMLTQAWNEIANNVWEEVQKEYDSKFKSMSQEEQNKVWENYGWVKVEQEKRQKVKALQKSNYEERKSFYSRLFADNDKEEFFFGEQQFEKRLVEEFKERGEEICNNNIDDNNNGEIDCGEAQCGGKICGEDTIEIINGNETGVGVVDLYCIASTCRKKEETVNFTGPVCGNNVCEDGERGNREVNGTCQQDCVACPVYPAIECSGRVVFSGVDENSCPLEPICIEEVESCSVDSDCIQPLCGSVACIEGTCQVTALTECRDSECVDGQNKVVHCLNGEDLVTDVCIDELWSGTNVECESQQEEVQGEVIEEEAVGTECNVKEDCGNANDVCSNGRCVTIPEIIQDDISQDFGDNLNEESEGEAEQQEFNQEQEQPDESSESPTTGSVIFGFFRSLLSKLQITGAVTEDEGSSDSGSSDSGVDGGSENTFEDSGSSEQSGEESQTENDFNQGSQQGEQPQQNDFDNREDREREEDERRGEEKDRRENECRERCGRECYDMKIRPCVEECIFEGCGENFECNVDEITSSCETSCKEKEDLNSCESECNDKCLSGEETWKQPEGREHKEEKGVFTVGGGCREDQGGKIEAFLWFNGWGDPFEKIQPLKQKYYSGGESDWCKWDMENLKKRREAFEQGFNQQFLDWFFNSYLANSAEDWEQHMSGIFELYWSNIDTIMQTAYRSQCLGRDYVQSYTPIGPIKYESDYGTIEYWEEIKPAKLQGMEKEVELITPYMKVWVLPSEEVLAHEMQRAMEEHKMPGPQEGTVDDALSEDKKQDILRDEELSQGIKLLMDEYGGDFKGAFQMVDFETGEVVFNMLVDLNEKDLIQVTPMTPEELPQLDSTMQIDVNILYEIIMIEEKNMGGGHIESPPWARKTQPVQKVKDVVSGVKMYFKFRSLMNSAKVSPESNEEEIKDLFFGIMQTMMDGGDREEFNEEDFEKMAQELEGEESNGENFGEDKEGEYQGEDGQEDDYGRSSLLGNAVSKF